VKDLATQFAGAVLYVSDHGESLGEHGLFLHGMPYAIAPHEQTRVPMYAWVSPIFMRLERWDKTAKVTYDKRLLGVLTSLGFLEEHRHVVILGSVGVGKTFLASALGHIACRHGYSVRFLRADAMLRTLRQSRLDNSRDAEMVALTIVDLLILDDFALEAMSKEESRDVYQLFLERTGRASMIVTSNRDTAEWLAMFDDVMLAQSAVDRFKNAAFDFVIEGESYRPRLKPKLDEHAASPEPARHKPPVNPRSKRRR